MTIRECNKQAEEGKKISFRRDFTKEESLEYIKHYMTLTKKAMKKNKSKLAISTKNRKINHMSFSVTPILTCGKECNECHKYCYDMKSYIMYRDTRHSRNRNYLLSLQKDFVENMTNELKYLDVKHFRLHVGGDFYNQEYVNKWYEIIRKTPQIKFYAFTKKYNTLDLATNKPSNLILIGSINDYQAKTYDRMTLKDKGLSKVARVLKDGCILGTKAKVSGGFTCQGGVNKNIGCGRGCNKCFESKTFSIINFEVH